MWGSEQRLSCRCSRFLFVWGFFLFPPGNSHGGEGPSVVQQASCDHKSKPCKSTRGRGEMQELSVFWMPEGARLASGYQWPEPMRPPWDARGGFTIYLWRGPTDSREGGGCRGWGGWGGHSSASAPKLMQPQVAAVRASQATPRSLCPPPERPSHRRINSISAAHSGFCFAAKRARKQDWERGKWWDRDN